MLSPHDGRYRWRTSFHMAWNLEKGRPCHQIVMYGLDIFALPARTGTSIDVGRSSWVVLICWGIHFLEYGFICSDHSNGKFNCLCWLRCLVGAFLFNTCPKPTTTSFEVSLSLDLLSARPTEGRFIVGRSPLFGWEFLV